MPFSTASLCREKQNGRPDGSKQREIRNFALMPQELRQIQTEKQVQTLSVSQLAVAALVELPLAELAVRVENEMLDNEALEALQPGEAEASADTPAGPDEADGADNAAGGDALDDAYADYASEDELPAYLSERRDEADGMYDYGRVADRTDTLYDALWRQIGELPLQDDEAEVLRFLVGSLDERGFLVKDDATLLDEMAIYGGLYASAEELGRMRAVLKTLEPRGIGAASLEECLTLQLTADGGPDDRAGSVALDIVRHAFDDFRRGRREAVEKRLALAPGDYEAAASRIARLNPAPGRAMGSSLSDGAPAAEPDFFVEADEETGQISVTLNQGDVPRLRVSPSFRETLRRYGGRSRELTRSEQDTLLYARRKVGAAQNFIVLVERRRQTLLAVMRAIVSAQRDYFLGGDDEALLRPLGLKEVAEAAGVDISTVSRVVASKYVGTAYGLHPLKSLFSSRFTSKTGDTLSTLQAQRLLREIVGGEDKAEPLTDEQLSAEMARRGQPVARRTVVKYRNALGIPSAKDRRR